MTAVYVVNSLRGGRPRPPIAPEGSARLGARASASDADSSVRHTVKKNETLASIFTGYGLSADRALECSRSLVSHGLGALFPGDSLVLHVGADGMLKKLSLLSRLECWYHMTFDTLGVDLMRAPVEVITQVCLVRGRLETSIAEALYAVGEGDPLAAKLTDILAWDINFFIDPRKGDTFEILYTKRYAAGRPLGYGDILAARYVNAGREYYALGVPDSSGGMQYFDRKGRSVQKLFLKAPLSYSRISSRFSYSRRHPILGIVRPHLAVDYAAPTGTPVYAAADGVVCFAGWENGFGNLVRIRHGAAYEAYYGHLHLIPDRIRAGVRVKQGDVIGSVGATGLATGPHLDYRMKRGGRFVNPLAISAPAKDGIRDAEWSAFNARAREYVGLFTLRLKRDGCFVVEIARPPAVPQIAGAINGSPRGS